MLTSLATQLGRARRHRQPLFFAEVACLELAVAAVRAAEVAERGLVLTIDASRPLLYSLELTTATYLELGRLSHTTITVEVITGAHHVAVEQATVAGAQVITPRQGEISDEQYAALLSWAGSRLRADNRELVLFPQQSALYADPLIEVVRDSGVVAVRLPILISSGDKRIFSAERFDEAKILRVPVIAQPDMYTPHQLRRLRSLGLGGLHLQTELEEAYTAGLRAGLHNRSHDQLRQYLPKARLAVETSLAHYFQLF